MYIKTSQEFRLSYKVCCMYWCFFYRKEKRSSSTRIKAKKTYWQKNYSNSSSGVLFSAPLSLGLFLWIKRDSFNFKWKSLVAQPIILKLSIFPSHFWQFIWHRIAELFLLLGLKVNFCAFLRIFQGVQRLVPGNVVSFYQCIQHCSYCMCICIRYENEH